MVVRTSSVLLLLVFLLAWWPSPVERTFFVNELLSLAGIWYALRWRPRIDRQTGPIVLAVWSFILVGFLHAASSLIFRDIHPLGFLRNLQVVYSAFAFFVGVQAWRWLQERNLSPKHLLLAAMGGLVPNGGTLSLAAIAPGFCLQRVSMMRYLAGVAGLVFAFGVVQLYWGATPLVFVMAALAFAYMLKKGYRIKSLRLIVPAVPVILVALFLYFRPMIAVLLNEGFAGFISSINMDDANAAWRLAFWLYLIDLHTLSQPLGIGLGVPLFPESLGEVMNVGVHHDPMAQYTMGAHNSFVTILVRLGVFGLLPFFVLMTTFVRICVRYAPTWYRLADFRRLSVLFAIIGATIHAAFNVAIESPIYSSTFWVTWGIFYAAVRTWLPPQADVPAPQGSAA